MTEPAYVTVILNGVVVQHRAKILGPTKHRAAAGYDGIFPPAAPLRLQDHGNSIPDRMRNVWIRPLN